MTDARERAEKDLRLAIAALRVEVDGDIVDRIQSRLDDFLAALGEGGERVEGFVRKESSILTDIGLLTHQVFILQLPKWWSEGETNGFVPATLIIYPTPATESPETEGGDANAGRADAIRGDMTSGVEPEQDGSAPGEVLPPLYASPQDERDACALQLSHISYDLDGVREAIGWAIRLLRAPTEASEGKETIERAFEIIEDVFRFLNAYGKDPYNMGGDPRSRTSISPHTIIAEVYARLAPLYQMLEDARRLRTKGENDGSE